MTPELHRLFPRAADSLPFHRLGTAPTPVSQFDGLWFKDEGVYGDGGWGGNKVRKLEWILPALAARGCRQLVTVGATGTNWGLAAALYGREFGIDTALALIDQPMDAHVAAQLERLEDSGASVHRTRTKARTMALAPWLFARHMRGLRAPAYLPAGGSSPVGALGYVEAALELAGQVRAGELPEPAHIVTAVGSGGTAAGLALGLAVAGLRTRVHAVVVNDTLPLGKGDLLKLAGQSARLLGTPVPELAMDVTRDWLGQGYGHPTAAGQAALEWGAERGLQLDPVYSAKACAAAMDLMAAGTGPVLLLGTYGPR